MSLYITFLITFAGSVGALFNPFFGLLGYVAFAIIKPDTLWEYNVPQANYSRILAICMLIGWLVRGFGSWKLGKGWAVTLLLTLHVAWVGFGTFFVTPYFDRGFYILDILLKILLPFLVGMTTVQTVGQLKWLIFTMIASVAVLGFELNFAYYVRGFNLLMQSSFLKLDNNCVGIILVPALGFSVNLLIDSRRWLERLFYAGVALMLLNAVCFSYSRGTMLATLITAVVTFVLMPKRLIHFVVFGALLVVGARLAGEDTIKRFSTMFSDELQKDGSAQSRRELWGQAFSVMLSHPLTGIGPGQWDLEVTRFGWKQGKQVHSTWLQNGAEGGVPGFVVYLAFYLVCIAQMLRISWRPTPEDLARPFLVTSARMAAAALIGFMVASQFVTVWAVEMPYYACLVGALVMKLRDSDPADQEPVEDDDVEAAWDDDDPSPLFYEPATAEFVQR